MTDLMTIIGWAAAILVFAAGIIWLGRLFLIWLFNRISDHIEHHVSQAIARPLYGNHKTLDDEYRELITNQQEDPNGN